MSQRLLPLSLSAHPSSWGQQDAREGGGGGNIASYRYCGLEARSWQEPFHVNGDHADARGDNLVCACVLCHLTQHLDRPMIEQEALVIYGPEMSQAVVNAIARQIHLTFFRHGEALPVGQRSFADTSADLRGAYGAFKALEERSALARSRLGIESPRELGAALMDLSLRPSRLKWDVNALRLLPLGRYFRGGEDVYPALLEALSRDDLDARPRPFHKHRHSERRS
jgi:hypothetical protein